MGGWGAKKKKYEKKKRHLVPGLYLVRVKRKNAESKSQKNWYLVLAYDKTHIIGTAAAA